jgi:hypothetical protein
MPRTAYENKEDNDKIEETSKRVLEARDSRNCKI